MSTPPKTKAKHQPAKATQTRRTALTSAGATDNDESRVATDTSTSLDAEPALAAAAAEQVTPALHTVAPDNTGLVPFATTTVATLEQLTQALSALRDRVATLQLPTADAAPANASAPAAQHAPPPGFHNTLESFVKQRAEQFPRLEQLTTLERVAKVLLWWYEAIATLGVGGAFSGRFGVSFSRALQLDALRTLVLRTFRNNTDVALLYNAWNAEADCGSDLVPADKLWRLAAEIAPTSVGGRTQELLLVRAPDSGAPPPLLANSSKDATKAFIKEFDAFAELWRATEQAHGDMPLATNFLRSQPHIVRAYLHRVREFAACLQLTLPPTAADATVTDLIRATNEGLRVLISDKYTRLQYLFLAASISSVSHFSPRLGTAVCACITPAAVALPATSVLAALREATADVDDARDGDSGLVRGVMVPASIHGSLQHTLIDSGADASFASSAAAAKLGLTVEPIESAPEELRSAVSASGHAVAVRGVASFTVVIGGAALHVRYALIIADCPIEVAIGCRDLWGHRDRKLTISRDDIGVFVIVGNGKLVRALSHKRQRVKRITTTDAQLRLCSLIATPVHASLPDGALLIAGDATDHGDDDDTSVLMALTNDGVIEMQASHALPPLLLPASEVLAHTLGNLDAHPAAARAPSKFANAADAPPPEWLTQLITTVETKLRAGDISDADSHRLLSAIRERHWRQFAVNDRMATGATMPPAAKNVIFSVRLHPHADLDQLRARSGRHSPEQQRALDALAEKLLANGAARVSQSPVRSAAHVIPKSFNPDGSVAKYRAVIDYRRVNAATLADATPTPRIDETLEWLCDADTFFKIDGWQAFHQAQVEDASVPLTAADFGHGLLLEFLVMPLGLRGAPAVWCRFMLEVLRGMPNVRAYFDDVLGKANTARGENIIDVLLDTLERAEKHGVVFSAEKFAIGSALSGVLGHDVRAHSYSPLASRVREFEQLAVPTTKEQLTSALALVGHMSRHYPMRAAKTVALKALLNSPRSQLTLTGDALAEWTAFQRYVAEDCIALGTFHDTDDVVVYTDYAKAAASWVVAQIEADGKLRLISSGSRANTSAEQKYGDGPARGGAFQGEMHALRTALRHERHFLLGRRVAWRSDNEPLVKWFNGSSISDAGGSGVRTMNTWLELSEYDITASYVRGDDNGSDYISRFGLATRTTTTTTASDSPAAVAPVHTPSIQVLAPLTRGGAQRERAAVGGSGGAIAAQATAPTAPATSKPSAAPKSASISKQGAARTSRAKKAAKKTAPTNATPGAAPKKRGRPVGSTKPPSTVIKIPFNPAPQLDALAAAAAGFVNARPAPGSPAAATDSAHALEQPQSADSAAHVVMDDNWRAQLIAAQKADASLKPWRDAANGVRFRDLQCSDIERQHIRQRMPFWADDGALMCVTHRSPDRHRLLVPPCARPAIVHAAHTDGHFAAGAMLVELMRSFYWLGMERDVLQYATSCVTCQSARQHQRRADLGEALTTLEPMALCQVDLQGPVEGHYILTILDVATRMQYAVCTKTKDAKTVARAFCRALYPHTQYPLTIMCDGGTEFQGAFKAEMQRLGIDMVVNAPYNPDARGAVERVHRVNLGVLGKMRATSKNESIQQLVERAVWAVNTRAYEDTGVCAYEAARGARAWTLAERRAMSQSDRSNRAVQACAANAMAVIATLVHLRTAERIASVQTKREQNNRYRKNLQRKRFHAPPRFSVGMRVWYRDDASANTKLAGRLRYGGPYEITDLHEGGHSATLASNGNLFKSKVDLSLCVPYVDPRHQSVVTRAGNPKYWLTFKEMELPYWLTGNLELEYARG